MTQECENVCVENFESDGLLFRDCVEGRFLQRLLPRELRRLAWLCSLAWDRILPGLLQQSVCRVARQGRCAFLLAESRLLKMTTYLARYSTRLAARIRFLGDDSPGSDNRLAQAMHFSSESPSIQKERNGYANWSVSPHRSQRRRSKTL